MTRCRNDQPAALAPVPSARETSVPEALRLRPNFPEAHNDLGETLAVEGKQVETKATFREALNQLARAGPTRRSRCDSTRVNQIKILIPRGQGRKERNMPLKRYVMSVYSGGQRERARLRNLPAMCRHGTARA
jgi:hypothetical protein